MKEHACYRFASHGDQRYDDLMQVLKTTKPNSITQNF